MELRETIDHFREIYHNNSLRILGKSKNKNYSNNSILSTMWKCIKDSAQNHQQINKRCQQKDNKGIKTFPYKSASRLLSRIGTRILL